MNIPTNKYQAIIDDLTAFDKKKEKIIKALNEYKVKIQIRADKEKDLISAIVAELTENSETTPRETKKTKEKRIKLSDEEILEKVKEILSVEGKLSKKKIAEKIGINSPRFEKFFKINLGLFQTEGVKKTSLISLK
jgi:hypothetical protein